MFQLCAVVAFLTVVGATHCDHRDKELVKIQWRYATNFGEDRFHFNMAVWQRGKKLVPEDKVKGASSKQISDALHMFSKVDYFFEVLDNTPLLNEQLKIAQDQNKNLNFPRKAYEILIQAFQDEAKFRVGDCFATIAWHECGEVLVEQFAPPADKTEDVTAVEDQGNDTEHHHGNDTEHDDHPENDTEHDKDEHVTLAPATDEIHPEEDHHEDSKVDNEHKVEEANETHAEGEAEHTEGEAEHTEVGAEHTEGEAEHTEVGAEHTEGGDVHAEGAEQTQEKEEEHPEKTEEHLEGSEEVVVPAEDKIAHADEPVDHAEDKTINAEENEIEEKPSEEDHDEKDKGVAGEGLLRKLIRFY